MQSNVGEVKAEFCLIKPSHRPRELHEGKRSPFTRVFPQLCMVLPTAAPRAAGVNYPDLYW